MSHLQSRGCKHHCNDRSYRYKALQLLHDAAVQSCRSLVGLCYALANGTGQEVGEVFVGLQEAAAASWRCNMYNLYCCTFEKWSHWQVC